MGAQIWRNVFGISYVLAALSMVAVNATIDAILGSEHTSGNLLATSPMVLLLVLILDTASRGAVADGTVLGELRGFAAYRAGQVFQSLMYQVAGTRQQQLLVSVRFEFTADKFGMIQDLRTAGE